MANYKGHIAGGTAAAGLLAVVLSFAPLAQFARTAGLPHDWQAIAAIFIIGILFALFPDVDTNSKAQDIFFWLVFPLDILLIASNNLQAAAYLGVIAMLPILGHHRGWTHSKWAMLAVPLPIVAVPYLYSPATLRIALVYYAAAVFGYFSHLLLDGLIWSKFRFKN